MLPFICWCCADSSDDEQDQPPDDEKEPEQQVDHSTPAMPSQSRKRKQPEPVAEQGHPQVYVTYGELKNKSANNTKVAAALNAMDWHAEYHFYSSIKAAGVRYGVLLLNPLKEGTASRSFLAPSLCFIDVADVLVRAMHVLMRGVYI